MFVVMKKNTWRKKLSLFHIKREKMHMHKAVKPQPDSNRKWGEIKFKTLRN